MTNPPTISVIIPVKNGSHTLGRALSSIALQTIAPAEVIVVDNRSDDDTVDVARSYADRLPIVVDKCTIPGSGAARNSGMRRASGALLAFLDADDVWYPRKTELQLQDYSTGDFFSGTYMHYLTPSGRILGDNVPHRRSSSAAQALRTGSAVPMPLSSIIVSRPVMEMVGGFDETFRRAQDFEWMRRVAQFVDIQAPTIEPLVGYVLSGGSSTDDSYVEQALAADAVRESIRSGLAPNYTKQVLEVLKNGTLPRAHRAGAHYRRAGVLVGEKKYMRASRELLLSSVLAPAATLRKLRFQTHSSNRYALPTPVKNLFAGDQLPESN